MKRTVIWMIFVALVWIPSLHAENNPDEPTARQLLDAGREHSRALEFDVAFGVFHQAVDASRLQGDLQTEAEALLALGLTHRRAGAPQLALRWIDEALTVHDRLTEPAAQAQVMCELARTLNAVGRRQQALETLAQAAAIFDHLDDLAGAGRVDALRSLVSVHARNYAQAAAFGKRAVDNPLTPADDRLRALAAIAYALHQQQRWPDALAAYDAVLDLAWQRNDQSQLGFAYCNRAEVLWNLGQEKPALQDLWQAVKGFEQGRYLIPSTGDQRSAFITRQIAAYDRLIRYLVDTSQSKKAFEVAERFHARAFLEMLDQRANQRLAQRHPELVEQRHTLLDALGSARLALEEEGTESDLATSQVETIHQLEGGLLDVEAQLLWRGRDLRQQPTTPEVRWQDLGEGLHRGEALVAYWVSEDRTFAWSLLDGSLRLTQIRVPRQDLEEAVASYLGPLRSARQAEDLALSGEEDRHLATGRQLHDWLISSLPNELDAARRLIVVSDGLLHYLPFEALVVGCENPVKETQAVLHQPYARCSYLGLERPLAYSPSGGALLALRHRSQQRSAGRQTQRPELLALAPTFLSSSLEASVPESPPTPAAELRRGLLDRAPLAHARQEAERIAALFPTSSELLVEQASEGRLKEEAGRYRFVHLATHGLVNDELPMSSGLLLADGDGEDGLLQAHEVLGLHLQADLVTLSACRTGRGQLRRGEGIVGLSRAFLTAGASSVMVSLWDVDDRSTPLLMEHFYRYVAAGLGSPEALVKARRHLFVQQGEGRLVFRQRPVSYAHPRFWASFVLVGGL